MQEEQAYRRGSLQSDTSYQQGAAYAGHRAAQEAQAQAQAQATPPPRSDQELLLAVERLERQKAIYQQMLAVDKREQRYQFEQHEEAAIQQRIAQCDAYVAKIHTDYSPQMQRLAAARGTTETSPPLLPLSYEALDRAVFLVRGPIMEERLAQIEARQQQQQVPGRKPPGK